VKIVAALCWYLEPTEFLDRLVRSLAGHVDELVGLDGAWYGFTPAAAASSREERDTIRVAAAECGIPVQVVVPSRVWKSQIEKRQRLFDIAIHERGADWVMVVDGDWELACCDDLALRSSLQLTGRDVAMVMMRPLNKTFPYSELPTMDKPERHIWRGLDDLTVENLHWGIRSGARWLHGDTAYVNVEPALDLSSVVVFDHDNMNRPRERAEAMREYRKVRQDERLETWR
jgi:hypothetical protein